MDAIRTAHFDSGYRISAHRRVCFKIPFIAKTNTIAPATSNAAPANKVTFELERPIDDHINNARLTNAIEIIISRRWALRIKTRIELNGITVDLATVYRTMAYKKERILFSLGIATTD